MILLENVCKCYDADRYAVRDISLRVAAGQMLVLLGGSGCGKTTTLKMINRLIEPTSGCIEVNGQDVRAADPVRLRRAELERAAAEARAVEERKRRRVSLALAASVLALVAVGAGGGLLVQHQAAERRAELARREAEQRQQVEAALDKAATLRQQAHWGEAAAVLDQARQALGDAGPGDLRHRLDVADAELALVNRLDAIRQRRAMIVEGQFNNRAAARDYAAAFREAGLGEVGDDEAAVAGRVRASAVAGPLVAALDDWAFAAADPQARSWLLGVARRAAPDSWGDRFRDPAVWQDRQALRALAEDALRDDGAKLSELSPHVLKSLGSRLGGGAEAVPLLRAAQRHYPSDFWLSLDLGSALYRAEQAEEAAGYFRVAVALRPDASAAHNNLGLALAARKDVDGAVAAYRRALDLDPKHAKAHTNLGNALYEGKKDVDGAIKEYHRALDLDPKYAKAHTNLGRALYEGKKDVDGAIRAFRRAIDCDPKHAPAHSNLGNALYDKGDLAGAIDAHHKAIELDPRLANAHYNLGLALYDKKDLDGAIRAYQKAIVLDPGLAMAHYGLGLALYAKQGLAEAIAAYRQAIELDPKLAGAHTNLGLALRAKKDLDGAIAAYRQAIELDPKLASAHYNLAHVLSDKGDVDGAIAAYGKAIEIAPDYAEAHCNLGHALRNQGRLVEALEELRRGHALGSQRPGWPFPSADWVRQCERLVNLDRKLPAVLSGEAEPADATERLALGQLCGQYKRRYAAAVRFYADAFAADGKLTDNLDQQHRYHAACSAARAAAGQGEDAKRLPDKARLMLRRQALAWLRDDLAAYRKLAERDAAAGKQLVRERMQHWQRDADLASVRDPQALGQLPEDERRQWHQLWEEVATLLKKVEQKP
jgi:tetratricopeptide (TPR) repeat protein